MLTVVTEVTVGKVITSLKVVTIVKAVTSNIVILVKEI